MNSLGKKRSEEFVEKSFERVCSDGELVMSTMEHFVALQLRVHNRRLIRVFLRVVLKRFRDYEILQARTSSGAIICAAFTNQ